MTKRCYLKIAKTTKEDAAEYTCAIDNKQKTTCQLVIEEPEWRFSKRLPIHTENVEYGSIDLECETEDPDAECVWLFDGKQIDPRDEPEKYEISTNGLKRTLTIKNLDPKRDPGRYECKCGFVITGTSLFVREAMRITRPLEDIVAVEQTSIEMTVLVNKDDQKPKWFKSLRQINTDEKSFGRYSIKSNGKEHKLVVNNLELKDAGEFEIKFEFTSSKCKLVVNECELFIYSCLSC